jgi:hypothetical protein
MTFKTRLRLLGIVFFHFLTTFPTRITRRMLDEIIGDVLEDEHRRREPRAEVPLHLEPNEHRALLHRASSCFRFVELLVPKRISREELGESLEMIREILSDPAYPNKRRAVWWKVATTMLWILGNAIRNVSAAIQGKKAE